MLVHHDAPGTLGHAELRPLWRLRTSLLRLKAHVDPELDFERFSGFVRDAHVSRVVASDGRALAMCCHQRVDGEFEGRRYRLAIFEYGFVSPSARRHPSVALCLGGQLLACRSMRPGVHDYMVGIGYPRSVVLLARAVPNLRLDGDPELRPIERHLLAQAIERLSGPKFDHARRVAELPTIPEPIRPDWLARQANNRLLDAYLAQCPDWEQGRALPVIGRLDGSLTTLAGEFVRRLGTGIERFSLRG